MIEDRREVAERAWGLIPPSGGRRDNVMQEQAVIQNQDLEHRRETYVSNKGVKVPAPMVDRPARRDVEEEANQGR